MDTRRRNINEEQGSTMKARMLSGVVLLLVLVGKPADACRFTPLEWQQTVTKTPNPYLRGQRKHTSWSRDLDRNFIDDRIERRFRHKQLVDIVVDLNQCVTPDAIVQRFSRYGRIGYVSRLVTYLTLDDVRFDELPDLAAMNDVAMIEWQSGGRPSNDVSTRAVQARASFGPYLNASAENRGHTGGGVAIAVLDTGVQDSGNPSGHEAFPKFVAGFNARHYEDRAGPGGNTPNGVDDTCEGLGSDPICESGSGTTNPNDSLGHGTHVAGTALSAGKAGRVCRLPNDGSTTNCAGTAPAAGLVDVQVCEGDDCDEEDVGEALDWLVQYAATHQAKNLRVANLSLMFCDADPLTWKDEPDDGSSALAQHVNYVVALGIVVAAAHGNSSKCSGLDAGENHSTAPGSSSQAITVAASNDNGTVPRTDDQLWTEEGNEGYLVGPRKGFDPANPDVAGLKPDIAAPGDEIHSANHETPPFYRGESGTSTAAPHVAGAAAVIIGARPDIDPGGLKDLLTSKADRSRKLSPYPPLAGNAALKDWDKAWGWGLLNVDDALMGTLSGRTADVRFPTCVGPGWTTGMPCALTAPLPPWNNGMDITTSGPPMALEDNEIIATVHNAGPAMASFNVNFGVYVFGVGNNQFFHVGTQRVVNLPATETAVVVQPWKPADSLHQCVQVSIDYGLDTNFSNNVTQRNLQVGASVYEVQVENPFLSPATMRLSAKSERVGWICKVDQDKFTIDPFKDCPRKVRVEFDAPLGAAPGEFAHCEIEVSAEPLRGKATLPGLRSSGGKPVVIGGVTVKTLVPEPCRVIGKVVDAMGRSLRDVKIALQAAPRSVAARERTGGGAAVELVTDEVGVFVGTVTPHIPHRVEMSHREVTGTMETRFQCGIRQRPFVLTREGLAEKD